MSASSRLNRRSRSGRSLSREQIAIWSACRGTRARLTARRNPKARPKDVKWRVQRNLGLAMVRLLPARLSPATMQSSMTSNLVGGRKPPDLDTRGASGMLRVLCRMGNTREAFHGKHGMSLQAGVTVGEGRGLRHREGGSDVARHCDHGRAIFGCHRNLQSAGLGPSSPLHRRAGQL